MLDVIPLIPSQSLQPLSLLDKYLDVYRFCERTKFLRTLEIFRERWTYNSYIIQRNDKRSFFLKTKEKKKNERTWKTFFTEQTNSPKDFDK